MFCKFYNVRQFTKHPHASERSRFHIRHISTRARLSAAFTTSARPFIEHVTPQLIVKRKHAPQAREELVALRRVESVSVVTESDLTCLAAGFTDEAKIIHDDLELHTQ